MKIRDYFLMKTPEIRLGDSGAIQEPPLSKKRIALSMIGLVFGIVLSFVMTCISKTNDLEISGISHKSENVINVSDETISSIPELTSSKNNCDWASFWRIAVFSIIITILTYPYIYGLIKVYKHEPSFIMLFISFQYGYFWQSTLKTAVSVIG